VGGSEQADGGAVVPAPHTAPHRRRRLAVIAAGLAGAAAALVAGGVILGTVLAGGGSSGTSSPTPTVGAPIPPPAEPPSAFPSLPTGSPQVAMLQPLGDPATVFLIHGTGWVPRSHVTVKLAGRGASPVRPAVDDRGTFNYALNQGHEFFPGPIPPGVYHVVVTGPGGRRARASFQVHGPPPGQAPPGQ
jgi:hypothetical protein